MKTPHLLGHSTATCTFALIALLGFWAVMPAATLAGQQEQPKSATEFLKLCDMACEELNKEITPFEERQRTVVEPNTHHVPFFEDSYGVRALCVAYDMTGKKAYLDACQHWADRVVAYQEKMTPKGAYYLNYAGGARQPGGTSGQWWVADSGSVALGILATAVRTADEQQKQRYVDSVKSFATLVIDNYVSKDGGIQNGLWATYSGPWWCSSATFSTAAYLLYAETGDPQCLKVATGATDWLLRHDFRKTDPPAWDAMGGSPAVVFYCGESHAIALKCLPPADPRRKALAAQVALMVQWMQENQQGRGAKSQLNYLKEATYMAGIPCLMYAFAEALPEHPNLSQAADQELDYVHGLLWKNGPPQLSLLETWELTTWAMMSYAEKLRPGALYRTSRR
jgi:hypothetical protein